MKPYPHAVDGSINGGTWDIVRWLGQSMMDLVPMTRRSSLSLNQQKGRYKTPIKVSIQLLEGEYSISNEP